MNKVGSLGVDRKSAVTNNNIQPLKEKEEDKVEPIVKSGMGTTGDFWKAEKKNIDHYA